MYNYIKVALAQNKNKIRSKLKNYNPRLLARMLCTQKVGHKQSDSKENKR